MKVILLGTGTSHGVPMIGCDCPVCTSDDPRDQRSRPGIVIQFDDGHALIVDTPPELRLQCVANRVSRVDAVFFTHAHADHIGGLDDLRRFNWLAGKPLNCYTNAATAESLRKSHSYAFQAQPDYPSHKPDLHLVVLEGPFEVGGHEITPIPLMHGPLPVLGLRTGRFAYCTDCNYIPDSSLDLLRDLDVLVLDALRLRPHPTHFNLEQAVEMAARIAAARTYFTHIAHELRHAEINAQLPPAMALGYDGQVIDVR